MMPKMNGMEVCRRVKKELALDNVFIVLLTAKGQELDRQKGQEVGADVYMTKPFDPEAILAKERYWVWKLSEESCHGLKYFKCGKLEIKPWHDLVSPPIHNGYTSNCVL